MFVLLHQGSKAQGPETATHHRQLTPALPSPPLLTQLTYSALLLPPKQCKKVMPLCLPTMTRIENDCAWSTMGRTKRREERVLYLFPRWPSLTLHLRPAQLRLGTVDWKHNALQAVNHPIRAPSQFSPLPPQPPLRIIHMSKHIYSLKMSYNLM